ncbi:MAG: hypothetical protein JOZ51_18105 [Chloroflexi bacterium]|nr:hypothetical protein [Chloroflexota bacterium]
MKLQPKTSTAAPPVAATLEPVTQIEPPDQVQATPATLNVEVSLRREVDLDERKFVRRP